jgi:hypothetical protein
MMSLMVNPVLGAEVVVLPAWYWPSRFCGSMGASAGVCWRLKLRIPGRSYPPPYGLRRGECAGVASGVWSGVGDNESCEKVGEDGAVLLGEFGLERFTCR